MDRLYIAPATDDTTLEELARRMESTATGTQPAAVDVTVSASTLQTLIRCAAAAGGYSPAALAESCLSRAAYYPDDWIGEYCAEYGGQHPDTVLEHLGRNHPGALAGWLRSYERAAVAARHAAERGEPPELDPGYREALDYILRVYRGYAEGRAYTQPLDGALCETEAFLASWREALTSTSGAAGDTGDNTNDTGTGKEVHNAENYRA